MTRLRRTLQLAAQGMLPAAGLPYENPIWDEAAQVIARQLRLTGRKALAASDLLIRPFSV